MKPRVPRNQSTVEQKRELRMLSRPIVGSDDSCDLVSWFFS